MTTYCRAGAAEEVIHLMEQAMRQWHLRLLDAEVRIGVLWANCDDGPALRRNGYPLLATIKPLGLDWRVLTGVDAVLKIDERGYGDLDDETRLALVDHELSHINTIDNDEPALSDKDPATGRVKDTNVKRDDIGRPRLRTVPGDWNGGDGFKAVVERHGESAVEFINARRVYTYAQASKDEAFERA